MEILLEFVFEILLELVFSVIGEAMLKRAHRPVVGAIGAVLVGVMVGIVTVWVWPAHFIRSDTARLVNLAFAPLFVGGVLGMRGYLTAKQKFLGSSAVNGVLLAFCLGLVRYLAIPRL